MRGEDERRVAVASIGLLGRLTAINIEQVPGT